MVIYHQMQDVTGQLRAHVATKIIRSVLSDSHTVAFKEHAEDEMRNDNLSMSDVRNVLLRGKVSEPEFEYGRWNYHVTTPRICVVVAIRSETYLLVITAWRKTR